MAIQTTRTALAGRVLGWWVYGLGVMALALVNLAWGDLDVGQPLPKGFPDHALLASAVSAFMLVAGAAVVWRPTAAFGGAALAAYYALVVVLVMNGRVILAHPTVYSAYSGAAEDLAVAVGGLVVYALYARIDPALAQRLTRLGQVAFGLCAILFGGAHFVYLNLTTPLVPGWLPPNPLFWAYATGIGHIAAGLAISTGVQARRAAILLTAMYAAFTPLVHLPLLLTGHASHFTWSENALNLLLVGVAWVVADSLARPR